MWCNLLQSTRREGGEAMWGPGIKSHVGVFEVFTSNRETVQLKPRSNIASALSRNPGYIKCMLFFRNYLAS